MALVARACLTLPLLVLPSALGQPEPRYRYVATPVLEFKCGAEPPMLLPTAVAVARDGTVYVADGVHDRILIFAPTGQCRAEFHDVGGRDLSRPISVRTDETDRLWIADTGHQRVLVRAPDGTLVREVRWPEGESGGLAPDITDAAASSDGQCVWLVDNDHHRLGRLALDSNEFAVFGKFGESLGQFYYPFMLALDPEGEVFVTEAINGRVQILNTEGRVVGSLGAYGADLGNLYHPKGIALDADGNVWVADGRLGVIQVFKPGGILLDVVRDEQGQPLRLETPCGIALDQKGELYVTEELPSRVRKFAIAVNQKARPPALPGREHTGGVVQPRTCTACHMEWLEPLARGESTALITPPVSTREDPAVSRTATCVSCHDGSVVDSRRRVWGERGHRISFSPPAGFTVPGTLPLVGGNIVCRTCHAAHTRGGAGASFAEAVFLRVKDDPAELCAACHAGFGGGASAGMHPLGSMPIPVPAAMVHLRQAAPTSSVTCLACHAGHGAPYGALLVLSPKTNELCLACHEALSPTLFGDQTRSKHGRLPRLSPEQHAVADGFGTRRGRDDELLCLTCHLPHHAPTQRYLLAFDLRQQDTCVACHAAERSLIGSSHDLCTDFPQERNMLGRTAEEGGPCSSCHLAHRYARVAIATPLDPCGRCISCHAEGQIAAAKRLGTVNHPQAPCNGCHNPHETRFGHYLAGRPSDVCRSCHAGRDGLAGGPHDMLRSAAAWPANAVATNDACLACHRPHGSEQTGLFRAGLAQGVVGPDAACLECHAKSAPHTRSPIALVHPRDANEPAGPQHQRRVSDLPRHLPLATSDHGGQCIACRTCHNPHADTTATPRLLRIEPGSTAQQLCLDCHAERKNIQTIGHAQEPLRAAGFNADGCRPCHVVHADPQTVVPPILWPKALAEYEGLAATPPADRYCRACHRQDGPVAPPAIASHPDVQMFNPDTPGASGYLPLFNAQGQEDPNGKLGCRTCHLTHGRTTPTPVPANLGALSLRELRARIWHIRTFAATNVCTTCHGFDALRRFMYFHDPARRGGPINTGGGGGPPARGPS